MEILNRLKLRPTPKSYNDVIINIPIKSKIIEIEEEDETDDIEKIDEEKPEIDTTYYLKGVKKIIVDITDIDENKDIEQNEDNIINYVEDLEEKEPTTLSTTLGTFFGVENKDPVTDIKDQEVGIEEITKPIEPVIQVDSYDIGSVDDREEIDISREDEYVEKEPIKYINREKTKSTKDKTIDHEEVERSIIQKLPIDNEITELKPNKNYMNNRAVFINFINSLWEKKKYFKLDDKKSKQTEDKELYKNQKIVTDYLNIYSPYRGLLIYHGLGTGKTCTSIAVAEHFMSATVSLAIGEGLITPKKVVVMTPASLRKNYREQLKDCGNKLFKKKQYWEFVPLNNEYTAELLSKHLHIPVDYIEKKSNPNPKSGKKGGAWMMNIKKHPNFDTLNPKQQKSLNDQLDKMIDNKYEFLSYNGFSSEFKNRMKKKKVDNPFSNKVVIIDEAHNFISMIINKLGKTSKKKDVEEEIKLSLRLYDLLMDAENCRIILLTGTPIINYPNEIAVLFNILRGYIKTFTIKLNKSLKGLTETQIKNIFKDNINTDYIELTNNNELIITRNPYGFINNDSDVDVKYNGIIFEKGTDTDKNDETFLEEIKTILTNNKIQFDKNISKINFKCLPDSFNDFKDMFLEEGDTIKIKNNQLMKRRILGLTSYFKSPDEELMPAIESIEEVRIKMSDFQFNQYQNVRLDERQLEVANKKRKKSKVEDAYDDKNLSTYRIFSRQFCNFVFPEPIVRPLPKESVEKTLNACKESDDFQEECDNIIEEMGDKSYDEKVQEALKQLKNKQDVLSDESQLKIISPKFLALMKNIQNPQNKGLNLVYTQFKSVEGIGTLSIILEANGFSQFKIKKKGTDDWTIDVPEDAKKSGKLFAQYIGDVKEDEREVLRNIYNGDWEYLPKGLVAELNEIHKNNLYGEIIKILMITASGAEGINLKNTRFVHIIEPYWHPVRTEQVIGRARRLKSHDNLPKKERNVKVFMYLMEFTQDQIDNKMALDIKKNDISKVNKKSGPLTSDLTLYEISKLKENISDQILLNLKETAIDCSVHSKDSKEDLKCYEVDEEDTDTFIFKPDINKDKTDTVIEEEERLNPKKSVVLEAKKILIEGKYYAVSKNSDGSLGDQVYDLEEFVKYQKGDIKTKPRKVGKWKLNESGKKVFVN